MEVEQTMQEFTHNQKPEFLVASYADEVQSDRRTFQELSQDGPPRAELPPEEQSVQPAGRY